MSEDSKTEFSLCPICNKQFSFNDIETHVNKCIFLNCEPSDDQHKRKRSPSPLLSSISNKKKSPKPPILQTKPRNSLESKTLAPLFQPKSEPSTSFQSSKNENIKPSNNNNNDSKKDNLLLFAVPLAKQVQPKSLDDFFGQSNVLGKNTVLRSLLEKGDVPNMILWGPPGCGKTSLSSVVHEMCKKTPKKLKFISLCAATCGVKEVQNCVTQAKNESKFGRKTILFMDEIHRFNKRQQDTFLLCVERGDIILIGATTENPSFCINSALLSRCRVIVMEKLQPEDLYEILAKAAESLEVDVVDAENPCGILEGEGFALEEKALKWLADISDGDARIALSNLQLTLQYCDKFEKRVITIDHIKEGIKKSHMLYDRAGEEHYNLISAMHKSIRGSDENAALYWTTRMIVSGENPLFIARRLVRAASEDIGNADPTALQLAVSTMQGCQLLGMPESDVLLAQCAIYLARAPKSREADSALAKAKKVIAECQGLQPSVPMHIRNAPTRLMKDLGYGQLKAGEEFLFMPPELKHCNFFHR